MPPTPSPSTPSSRASSSVPFPRASSSVRACSSSEPKEYKLTKSELERCGDSSYDFALAGFQVQSKVLSGASSKAVAGAKIQLVSEANEKQSSMSDGEGIFGFDKVKPGKYKLRAEMEGVSWKEA